MMVVLAGCQDLITTPVEGEGAIVNRDEGLSSEAGSRLIPVGEDLFMVPSGIDDQDCEMFRPFSRNNPVKAAMHYRQADGSFDIARDPEVCRVIMEVIGPDEDGCERYRAVPLNAALPPLERDIVYYRTSDGSYAARKPKDRCG